VLARNGLPLLERTLAAVLEQECDWPFEVLVVDSESTDGSWELAGSLAVERLRVRRADFNHGTTRNLAAAAARGEHVVFLVQDAVPADRAWLRTLVAAAATEGAVASYSRQLPHPTATGVVRCHLEAALPQGGAVRVQRLSPAQSWDALPPAQRFALATFRNNSSCIRRTVLREHPFRALPYGEDLEWGQRVVRAGMAVVYEPASMVYHSHDRSSWYELKRAYADHELVVRLFDYRVYPTARALAAAWATQLAAQVRLALREPLAPSARAALLARAAAAVSARHVGAWLGARAGGGRFPGHRLDTVLRRGV
jgi:rhamnosyltransferase